jgi:hypothetical protein
MSSDNLIAPKGVDQNKNKSPGASPGRTPNRGEKQKSNFSDLFKKDNLIQMATDNASP